MFNGLALITESKARFTQRSIEMHDLLVRNASVLNPDMSISAHKDVFVDGNTISSIADTSAASEASKIIDGTGKLVMPGFVDSHTHLCQTLLRGRTIEEWPMIWTRFLIPFESNLTEEDVYWGAQLACLEMIKSGTTAFIESGGIHMADVAEATIKAGLRAAIAKSTMDMGGVIPASMKETVDECMTATEELYNKYNGAGDDTIRIWFAMREVMTCSPELIRETAKRAAALNTGIHAHLCEHHDEVKFCLENYHLRPAELLEENGMLGPNFLSAHNVSLTEHDITILKKYDAKIVHCPTSNLSNHGFPKTPRFLDEGMVVALGSDGASSTSLSLFEKMRLMRYAMTAYWGIPVFDSRVMLCLDLMKMATVNGARAMLRDDFGTVEAGMKADFITLNIDQPHIQPTSSLLKTLVTNAGPGDVCDSVINGKIVMENRNVLTLDEKKVMEECTKRQKEIFARAGI